jgi:hypothetical protein
LKKSLAKEELGKEERKKLEADRCKLIVSNGV